MMPLGPARSDLDSKGFALLQAVLSVDSVRALREIVDRLQSSTIPKSRQVLYTRGAVPEGRPPLSTLIDQWLNPHRHTGSTSTRSHAEQLRPLAESLLGGPAVLLQDLVLVKRAGHGDFHWHQDYGYWPVDRPDGIVFWTALSGASPSRGALRFAVGSHRLGPRHVIDLHTGQPQDPSVPAEVLDGKFDIAEPTYAPGDVVAFTPVTFHASHPLVGPGERAAWSVIFLSSRCRWSHANAPNHPLCRLVLDGTPVHELAPS